VGVGLLGRLELRDALAGRAKLRDHRGSGVAEGNDEVFIRRVGLVAVVALEHRLEARRRYEVMGSVVVVFGPVPVARRRLALEALEFVEINRHGMPPTSIPALWCGWRARWLLG